MDTEPITDSIKAAISAGYKRILFDNINEAVYFDHIRKIHRIIRQINDYSVSYVYLTSAQNGQETYEAYCLEQNIEPVIKISCISVFENVMKENLSVFYRDTKHPKIEYLIQKKSKLFCCLNKQLREHRARIFYKILDDNFLEKTYSSFEYGLDVIQRLSGLSEYKRMWKLFTRYQDIFPLRLNVPDDRYNPIDVRLEDLTYHSDSYFSLVTETLFFQDHNDFFPFIDAGDSVFLTEKTFRPIALKHPFILASRPFSLQYLKKLGYKTFSPLIDESYDSELDDHLRLEMIWKEVLRLCDFTDDQWIKWQTNIKDILDHNYRVLMEKTDYRLDQTGV